MASGNPAASLLTNSLKDESKSQRTISNSTIYPLRSNDLSVTNSRTETHQPKKVITESG